MNINELKLQLRANAELEVGILLPDGDRVPAHYHITEVGHSAKKFVDCGGVFRTREVCVLQTHFGSRKDDGHRLTAGRLAHILDLAKPILPTDGLPVEVEYEQGVMAQYPLIALGVESDSLVMRLGRKHTDCLAKDKCRCEGGGGDEAAPESEACCAGSSSSGACC